MSLNEKGKPGTIALVGSGEYTAAMDGTDRYLLETIGGPTAAQVVIMATASGLEDPSSPARWTQMGLEHFERLGATVAPAQILQREDAQDSQWLPLLEQANFYYFSGGNPQHLIETLRDTPAWEIIQRNWQNGAVLAGCSAGAMALGGYTANIRSVMSGSGPSWSPALGVLPGIITIPHFDRMASFAGPAVFEKMLSTVPSGLTVVGVDEDSALVLVGNFAEPDAANRWQVMGSQTVSLFNSAGSATVYQAGEYVNLTEV